MYHESCSLACEFTTSNDSLTTLCMTTHQGRDEAYPTASTPLLGERRLFGFFQALHHERQEILPEHARLSEGILVNRMNETGHPPKIHGQSQDDECESDLNSRWVLLHNKRDITWTTVIAMLWLIHRKYSANTQREKIKDIISSIAFHTLVPFTNRPHRYKLCRESQEYTESRVMLSTDSPVH